ncbi:hypothetical protein MNBD_GAMMA26-1019 [hydrothermal vent metagenome]|uniref:NolW-like domain-containing protein n=1 Tax=hydrothermal vent metagenome TaxID=652676 RepID=A0A3B1AKD8_9ZZZZ
MKVKFTLLCCLYALICSPVAADAIEVIELQGRPANEIIPLIKPFIGPDDAVSGVGNQLIIRTSPERLLEIRKILAKFDQPPRRLMIYVRQGRLTENERQYLSAGSNAGAAAYGKAATIDNTLRLRVRSRSTRSDLDTTQRVQALTGKPAYIATGKAIPIYEQTTSISGGVIHQQSTTRYRNATTGFYVVAQLNGNRVTLQISSHQDRPGQMSGTFDIQQASTTVSGNLGEWIPVGGIDQSSNQGGSGFAQHRSTANREEGQIRLLIEEIQ